MPATTSYSSWAVSEVDRGKDTSPSSRQGSFATASNQSFQSMFRRSLACFTPGR